VLSQEPEICGCRRGALHYLDLILRQFRSQLNQP
jgi:hypothetical protein